MSPPDRQPGHPPEADGASARARQIELILAQVESLPTLSVVATRVLALSAGDDAGIAQISALIEADPALSTRVLSLSRRASVGMPAGITTVKRAMVMLGLEAVQAAILAIDIYEVMRQLPGSPEVRDDGTPAFDRTGFWLHSIAVGCCAQRLAEAHPDLHVRPDEAFTAGLVHDLGKLVLDWVMPRSFARAIQMGEAHALPLAQAERAVLGVDHHVVGKRLGEHWSLPHALQDVMWLHGQARAALPDVKHRDLIVLVTAADALVRAQHLGWSGHAGEPTGTPAVCAACGLDLDRVTALVPRVIDDVAQRARDLGLGDESSPQLVARCMADANQRLARMHHASRERAIASRRQARILQALTRFTGAARPGSGVSDVLTEIVGTFRALVTPTPHAADAQPGPAFVATLYQAREGEPWRLTRYSADGAPSASAHLDQPRDAEGEPIDLRALDHGESLGGAIGLLTWLSEHLAPAPDLRHVRVVPMISGVGPAAVLLHDARRTEFVPSDPSFGALCAAWAWSVAAAAQHDGARRLTEELAHTSRTLADTQAQLAEAQSMARLGELTAGAAHELNNPLTVISGRSQLLAQRLHSPRDKADAQQIAEAAQRLSDLVTKLHHVARPPEPSLRPADAMTLVQTAVARASERYHAAHPGQPLPKVRTAAQIPPGLSLSVDHDMVIRSLAEVILNAMEAVGVSAVVIRAQPGAVIGPAGVSSIALTVQDDGSGLSEHALMHAFDPFFSEKPAGRQTGLGLPLCRRLVEAHGGSVRLESVPGRGATATVTLPLRAPASGAIKARASKAA